MERDGHSILRGRIEADKPMWQALANKANPDLQPGVVADAILVDDPDKGNSAIKVDEESGNEVRVWQSHLAMARLFRSRDGSYRLTKVSDCAIVTTVSDKGGGRAYGSTGEGRGAELSAVEFFAGKLVSFCDRTGGAMEIQCRIKDDDDDGWAPSKAKLHRCRGARGKMLVVREADGAPENDPAKVEWSCTKNGQLVLGSTGRPHKIEGGFHEKECWVAAVRDDLHTVTYIDARSNYAMLRQAAGCDTPGSFLAHEAGRWSDDHGMWFFMPRKTNRESGTTFQTLVMGVREKNAGEELWGEWECEENGDGILLADTKLENYANRGVADFVFIPGTGDQHIFVLRTEEEEDTHGGDILNSYGSVIDLMGNVLMEEKLLLDQRKYEGLELAEPGALPALSGLKVIQGGGMCSCFGKQVEEPAAEGASATGNPLYSTTS